MTEELIIKAGRSAIFFSPDEYDRRGREAQPKVSPFGCKTSDIDDDRRSVPDLHLVMVTSGHPTN